MTCPTCERLRKELKGRIKFLETNKDWQKYDTRLVRIDEVKTLLKSLPPSDNEKG